MPERPNQDESRMKDVSASPRLLLDWAQAGPTKRMTCPLVHEVVARRAQWLVWHAAAGPETPLWMAGAEEGWGDAQAKVQAWARHAVVQVQPAC